MNSIERTTHNITKKALDNLKAPKIEQQRKMCLAEIEKGIAEEAPKR